MSLPDFDGDTRSQYRWACFELPTCSHIILVWHIATSICEMELAKSHDVDLGKPGFPFGLVSCCCCSSKPYLLDEKELPGKLQGNYIIANSLSQYCAYLLVSKPKLIPDSFLVPKMVFQETVKHARDHTLKGCDSLQSKYDKLKQEAEKAVQETDNVKKGEDILQQGAMLAKELLQENTEKHWKILADVWAELLVHIAPSWNAAAHKKCLESGGEFLTHIWALLWHCGIEKNKLWPVEEVPKNNAPGAPQDNNVKSNNVQTEQEMQQAGERPGEREEANTWRPEMEQAGPQVRYSRNENGTHDKDGTGSPVTETNNFRRVTEKEDTRTYEIEEDRKYMLVGEPNGQIDTQEQKQMERGMANAEEAGEGMASINSTESESNRGGYVMPWPDQEKCSRKDLANSRDHRMELMPIRMAGREDKQGMLKVATTDGGLVNRHGNVVRRMQNLGNTCYFNAVLQSLLALYNVRARMLGQDAVTRSLGQELKHLFMETSNACDAKGTLVPVNLFTSLCSWNSNFELGTMEDSNNILSSFLDGLYSEEPEMVESLFYGQVVKHVSSKECQHTSYTRQNLDLSLAIPSKKPVTIEDCLELYAIGDIEGWHCTCCSAATDDDDGNASMNQTDTTLLDDDQTAAAGNDSLNQTDTTILVDDQIEQLDSETHQKEQPSHPPEKQTSIPNQDNWKLSKLNGDTHQMGQNKKEEKKIYRAAAIEYRISKAPSVLTIQLKRFDYNAHHDTPEKLGEHVSFQETLDIMKFMDPGYMKNEDYIYCLVAVIVHDGPTLQGGHNYAYVRASRIGGEQQESGGTSLWFRASDEDVTEVSLKQVLDCQAYILFYERLEQSIQQRTDSLIGNSSGER